jgi:hypothetical protein
MATTTTKAPLSTYTGAASYVAPAGGLAAIFGLAALAL